MAAAQNKIYKYLERFAEEEISTLSYDNVYLVSDSKGRYLNREIVNINMTDPSVVNFYFKSGRRTEEGVDFVLKSLSPKMSDKNKTNIVLFWHQTCDLHIVQRPQLWLSPRYASGEELIESLIPVFDKLVDLHNNPNSNVKVGVLETPPVFASRWNRDHGNPDWRKYIDHITNNHVDLLNNYIRDQVNTQLNYVSPKFVCDFMLPRKRSHTGEIRRPLCADLLLDGVHPTESVARKWLHQIVKSVCPR